MKLTVLSFFLIFGLTVFSQGTINLPASLQFGMTMKQFQNTLQKQAYDNGTTEPMEINQYENFKNVYHLNSFTFLKCPVLGTLKPDIFTGLFFDNKLSVVRISFTGNVAYDEVKEALVSKYGQPETEKNENLQESGVCRVATWLKKSNQIRLYQNAAEPIMAPFLEYISLPHLSEAKTKKTELNKVAL